MNNWLNKAYHWYYNARCLEGGCGDAVSMRYFGIATHNSRLDTAFHKSKPYYDRELTTRPAGECGIKSKDTTGMDTDWLVNPVDHYVGIMLGLKSCLNSPASHLSFSAQEK